MSDDNLFSDVQKKQKCVICDSENMRMFSYGDGINEPTERSLYCGSCGFNVWTQEMYGVSEFGFYKFVEGNSHLIVDNSLFFDFMKYHLSVHGQSKDDEFFVKYNELISYYLSKFNEPTVFDLGFKKDKRVNEKAEKFREELIKFLDENNYNSSNLINSYQKSLKSLEKEKKLKEKNEKEKSLRWENGIYSEKELMQIEKEKEKAFKKNHECIIKGLIEVKDNFEIKKNKDKITEYLENKYNKYSKFMEENKIPDFLGGKNCFSCGYSVIGFSIKRVKVLNQVFEIFVENNAELEDGTFNIITGCPNCSKSFVD